MIPRPRRGPIAIAAVGVVYLVIAVWQPILGPPSWFTPYIYLAYIGFYALIIRRTIILLRQAHNKQVQTLEFALIIASIVLAASFFMPVWRSVDLGCREQTGASQNTMRYACASWHSILPPACKGLLEWGCVYANCVLFEGIGQTPFYRMTETGTCHLLISDDQGEIIDDWDWTSDDSAILDAWFEPDN